MSIDPGEMLELQVARMFYERQLSKKEIAAILGLSRFQVARVLDDARDHGVVSIQFREQVSVDSGLARALEERFELAMCVVFQGPELPIEEGKPTLGRLAAGIVSEMIRPGDCVGTGWGGTLAGLVDRLPQRNDPSIKVVQLFGGSARINFEVTPTEIARRMAHRLGAGLDVLYAPAFVESAEIREALHREPELESTVRMFDRVNLAILGIGTFNPDGGPARSLLAMDGFLPMATVRKLTRCGGIGDIALFPFDTNGQLCGSAFMPNAMGISLDQLRAVPRVVAVAGGTAKAQAIRGALLTGLVSILVTDASAARALLGVQ